MKGSELLRLLRKHGRTAGVSVVYDGRPGKGSHGRLYYGSRFTVIKDPKKEIGAGLLNRMLNDLGLSKDELT